MTPERFNGLWPNLELTQGADGYWSVTPCMGGQVTGYSPEVIHHRLCSAVDHLLDMDDASTLASSVARIRDAAKGATRENFRRIWLHGLDIEVSISAGGVPSVDISTVELGEDHHTRKAHVPRIRIIHNEDTEVWTEGKADMEEIRYVSAQLTENSDG